MKKKIIVLVLVILICTVTVAFACYLKNASTSSSGSYCGTCSNTNARICCGNDGGDRWSCSGDRYGFGYSREEAIDKACGCN